MNIHNLKEYIKSEDKIELILENVGFKNIKYFDTKGGEFRASWAEGTNPTSVCVNTETLNAHCFSMSVSGDIITLCSAKLELDLKETLKHIAKIIGYSDNEIYTPPTLPFGGFFNEIIKNTDNDYELETYSESTLDDYLLIPSKKFLEDGISYETQLKYKIGYDIISNRITIPWRNTSGEIVGIMGRMNKYELEDWEMKYLPVIPFSKSKALYGFYENYDVIVKKKSVMIFEPEKGVMKLDSMKINNVIGLGGNSLSNYQANAIKSLFCDLIIVGLDEGLPEEQSFRLATQLKMDSFFKNEVVYVYDHQGEFLPKGSKMSPSDLSKDNLRQLIDKYSKKV